MKHTLFISLALASALATAQEVMTPELLWKLGRVGLDDAHESGWVVYGVVRYDMDANKGNRDLFLVHAATGETRSLAAEPGSEVSAVFVKGGTRVAYVHANNVHVQSLADLAIIALTTDGGPQRINGTADWVNEEEFRLRNGLR